MTTETTIEDIQAWKGGKDVKNAGWTKRGERRPVVRPTPLAEVDVTPYVT